MSFIFVPFPYAPTYGSLSVKTASTGRTRAYARRFPLPKIVHARSFRRTAVPLTGQSRTVTPQRARRARARWVVAADRESRGEQRLCHRTTHDSEADDAQCRFHAVAPLTS